MTFSVSAPTNNTGALLNNGTEVLSIDSSNNVGISNNLDLTGNLIVNTDALYVDTTNNRVGIGTSSPSYPLDISSSVDPVIRVNCSGTGPNTGLSITKEQGSGDLANWNAITINGNDNVSYESRIQWIFDSIADGPVIGGKRTGAGETQLTFHTNSAETLYERMRIDSSGNIYMSGATGTPPGGNGFVFDKSSAAYPFLDIGHVTGSTTTGSYVRFYYAGTQIGRIAGASASSVQYLTTSDYRLKENNVDITDGISRVKLLKPYRFNFIAEPDNVVDGFYAHEVQSIVPESVAGTKDAVDDEGNPDYQAIDQAKLVPLLTAALKEAIAKIEDLETRIQTLENN